jgi:hypothetical protein
MFKKVVAIASVAALLTATAPAAFAHGYEHGGYRHGGGGHFGGGPLIALGALAGLAVGAAVLSNAYAAPPPAYYYPPPAYPAPGYYAPPAYYAPPPTGYGQ